MNETQTTASAVPDRLKRIIQSLGLVLVIIGTPFTINLFCIVPLILLNSGASDGMLYGVVSLTFALLTVGAGMIGNFHAQAINGMPNARLVAVCDEVPGAAEKLCSTCGGQVSSRPGGVPGSGGRCRCRGTPAHG